MKGIKELIKKDEGIKFLIENCYKKFPELMEKIPEETMKRVLDRNIKGIVTGGRNERFAGLYYPVTRRIQILNRGDIDLEGLRGSKNATGVFAHEGIHAMFRKSKTRGGISNHRGQINIKGFIKKSKVRYKSSRNIFELAENIIIESSDDFMFLFDFGRALDEGLTEWVKQKCVEGNETYENEVNVVNQIENAIGTKNVLKMVDKKPNEMHEIINMNKKEFKDFCNKMDYVFFLNEFKGEVEKAIIHNEGYTELDRFYEKEGKYLKDEINSAKVDVQIMLIEKVILPNLKKDSSIDYDGFKKMLKFKELILTYCDDYDMISKLYNTEVYTQMKDKLNNRIIQFARENLENVDKWDDKKIMQIHDGLFDYGHIPYNEGFYQFQEKILYRVKKIGLEREKIILDEVKQQILEKEKISIELLSKDYYDGNFAMLDINHKVKELILNRKLTYNQVASLSREITVYRDCGRVISKKDIKVEKKDNGKKEYYVLIDGKKYTNDYLREMKLSRKFVSSKKFEVVDKEEKEGISIIPPVLATINKKQSKLATIIEFLKSKLLKNNSRSGGNTEIINGIDKNVDNNINNGVNNNVDKKQVQKDDFRTSLKVDGDVSKTHKRENAHKKENDVLEHE